MYSADQASSHLLAIPQFSSKSLTWGHLQKFSDDSAIVGLITDDDDREYRELIKDFVDWCQWNRLQINSGKTKELVVDFRRRNHTPPTPVNIQGMDIERVDSYKYLGVHLNNKLDWTQNTHALYRKGQSRLYLLRKLRSFGVQGALLRTFFDTVVASAIFSGVVCWSSSISTADRKRLDKLIKKASSVLAQEGQTCDLGGVIYRSGESFQPSCKHHCVCMNGEIGCVPMCASDIRLPSLDCPYPRRIQIPGKCCEEWVCEQMPQDHHYQSVIAGASQIHPLPSSNPVSVFRQASPYEPRRESHKDNCIVQTTEWSECSATCGMAVSSRITNDNQRCQLERQTRICIIRPCNSQLVKEIKKGKKCVRTPKAQHGMHFELSGCSSTRLYKPKFCGVCTDNRCCTPHTTITAEVEFRCPEGDVFMKKMMFIKTCSCHHDCPHDNDIFLASNTRRMIGDYDNNM
nr:PREDICTED: connective tissue growth factor-like [Paralichthys olivaceus]